MEILTKQADAAAGAGQDRRPSHGDPFAPTQSPFADAEETAVDGTRDLTLPANGKDIMRALLRAWHPWASEDLAPPPSQYPRRRDRTLVSVQQVKFPALPGVERRAALTS